MCLLAKKLELAFLSQKRWLKEFFRGRNSLQDEERIGKLRSAVISDNVSSIRKMLMNDNRCTNQKIQKKLSIGSAAIRTIIHEELHMKKVVCRWVTHNLIEQSES
ncbi:histone-lysine N-methyltransferase SETMAR [Trichonephila clavipes]|nr:histone-lysine N-methyltransferase SETMAR [Trichonephila clavipes]